MVRLDGFDVPALSGYRIRIRNNGAIVPGGTIHLTDNGGGARGDFRVPLGALTDLNYTYELDIRGGGGYRGVVSASAINLHTGDGLASAAVRREVVQDIAPLQAALEVLMDRVAALEAA